MNENIRRLILPLDYLDFMTKETKVDFNIIDKDNSKFTIEYNSAEDVRVELNRLEEKCGFDKNHLSNI
jgi:hypothetical protein